MSSPQSAHFKKHWNFMHIGITIVEIAVVISIFGVIYKTFFGAGSPFDGLDKIFGAAENFFHDLFDGCATQQDCRPGSSDQKDCLKIPNCSFRVVTPKNNSSKSGNTIKKSACVSSTGIPNGKGLSSLGCFFGIGLIVTLLGFPVWGLYSFIKWLNSGKSENTINLETINPDAKEAVEAEVVVVDAVLISILELEDLDEIELSNKLAASGRILNELIETDPENKAQFEENERKANERHMKESGLTDPEEFKKNIPDVTDPEEVITLTQLLDILSPDPEFVIDGPFKIFVKNQIIRHAITLNTTQQAVLDGNFKHSS